MADEKKTVEDLEKELESLKKDLDKSKKTIENLTSENADKKREIQRKDDELKSKMSEQEKAEAERKESLEKMEHELAELRKEKAIATSKAHLLAIGLSDALADEGSKAWHEMNLDGFAKTFKTFLEEHDKNLKDELLKTTPKPPTGENKQYKTQDEIMAITDTAERRAAIAANPTLFGITE